MKSSTATAERRRVTLQIGIGVFLVVSTGLVSTACIFDRGDYQGGGRLGQAATANQPAATSSSSSSGGDDDDGTEDAGELDTGL